ncbi:MAG: hypothetical protein JXB50_08655 [Spirochaetes bacterium]|nr:hypothetical protein [Spirochaetota bacterium]
MPVYNIFRTFFGHEWETISVIRSLIEHVFYKHTNNFDATKLFAAAASELMENAYKYSYTKNGIIEIDYKPEIKKFIIKEINIAETSKIKTLKSILNTIHKNDPEEAYKNMMLRAFQNHKISQLGLAKIRYECNADIKLNTIGRITKKYRSYIGPNTLLGNIKLDENKKIIKITVLTDIIK